MSEASGTIAVALNSEQGSGSREQWVHLLPAGQFSGRDGRGPWSVPDAAAFISATARRQGQALPVDYEHQSDYASQNGQPAPAAGWIKELAPRHDGIWGRIEWTAKAAAHIAAREYRFISPTFQFRPDTGRLTSLLRAGLTNVPNLELVALARARQGANMDEMEELRDLLGLDSGAGLPEIVTSVRQLAQATATNRPDPAKFVPMDVFRNAIAELNVRNQGMTEELALNHVQEQMRQGKLIPFLNDWAVGLCKHDRPAFDKFVEQTGAGVYQTIFGGPDVSRKPPSATASKLSETNAAIARTLGHSEEEFIAANRSRMS